MLCVKRGNVKQFFTEEYFISQGRDHQKLDSVLHVIMTGQVQLHNVLNNHEQIDEMKRLVNCTQ
jgi:hypothetical protein